MNVFKKEPLVAIIATLASLILLAFIPLSFQVIQDNKIGFDKRWAGGEVYGLDIDFFDWAREQIPREDKYFVQSPLKDELLTQWTSFQLYPGIYTEDISQADWLLVYGEQPPNCFKDIKVYKKDFYLINLNKPIKCKEGKWNPS